jgi:hypothetical protein
MSAIDPMPTSGADIARSIGGPAAQDAELTHGHGLSELNGCVVAGEDDAVAGCHGEVVAIWRLGQVGSGAFCFVNFSSSRMTTRCSKVRISSP